MKDATQKLSKRNGDATYDDLIKNGYLKEAVLNYVALLGWSPGGEQEIYSLDGMIKAFSIRYFFRRFTKKPSASCNISISSLASCSSFCKRSISTS